MDIAEARRFLSQHHRGVLVTHKRDGGLQMSPVSPGIDGEGRVIITTRETAYKTKNIRRDPRISLCVFADAFHGSNWIQVNGRAEIVSLPEAMEPLIFWYRQVKGEHLNWAEYRQTMERERRLILRISIEGAGPDQKG
ncbi:MAG: PPOX class F420-dependent oxidoreductase [Deltaproteobacteria bacterium]|nr:PPOX class F420-dependent oxidoreductase [Deltaproteobacteria bacterium]